MHISDAGISFIITNKLKTTKRGLKPKLVKCVIPPKQAFDAKNVKSLKC